ILWHALVTQNYPRPKHDYSACTTVKTPVSSPRYISLIQRLPHVLWPKTKPPDLIRWQASTHGYRSSLNKINPVRCGDSVSNLLVLPNDKGTSTTPSEVQPKTLHASQQDEATDGQRYSNRPTGYLGS